MTKTATTVIAPATGRGAVPRIIDARRPLRRPNANVDRALDARRQLRPRGERFAHLTRMYD